MEGTVTIITNQYDVLKEKSISLDRILHEPKNIKVVLTDRVSHMFCSENVFTVVNADEFINNLNKEYERLTSENEVLKRTQQSFAGNSMQTSYDLENVKRELETIKYKWWYKIFNKR